MHEHLAPTTSTPPPASRSRARELARARASEGGFTLVEILVVLVILAILTAIAMLAFGGSKAAVKSGEAKAAGSAYLQGVSQWQSFSANRNPAASDFLPNGRGPRGLDGRPVMASAPAGVAEGRVAFFATGANCGATAAIPTGVTTQNAVVSFCSAGMQAPNFGIRVLTRSGPDAAWTSGTVCWLGVAATGARRC